MWQKSIVAINRYLAEQTRFGLWYGQADMRTGARTTHEYGALDAFFPAVLALAGDLPGAEALQRSSFQMWTLYGIEPDTLDYIRLSTPDAGYPLRPEIIESTYYLHHLTGDPIYLHMGQDYFDSLVRWCRTPDAYAALTDVRTKQQKDDMESFFFAETLKYLYLLYAPRDTVDLRYKSSTPRPTRCGACDEHRVQRLGCADARILVRREPPRATFFMC